MSENKVITYGQSTEWPSAVIINTDGASRGNPGAASLGYTVVSSADDMVFEYAEALGDQTNNYAEYMAIVRALEKASENGVKELTLRSDSQLLVRQLIGQYKVKSPGLKPLFEQCKKLKQSIPTVHFEHVRREFNKRADELANLVLDSY